MSHSDIYFQTLKVTTFSRARCLYLIMSIMKSNQHLQQINSTIFFWIPDIGCKNRGDEDSKIPTHLSKQSIPYRLFKLKTVGKLGETQLL